MFKHLMVPVDDSPLSAGNVTAAVELASTTGARITFFHATMDFSATSDGALLELIAPTLYANVANDHTNVILAKAAMTARAIGVPCELASNVSDHPADAIVDAARRFRCDLIVMASRGTKGMARWLYTSHTEHVLQLSDIPVLITRVGSAKPFTACERALAVIQDQHLSIAVVVHGLLRWASRTGQPAGAGTLQSLRLMLDYLLSAPLQQHHAKEDRYLHRRLRLRVPECDPQLREIEMEHAQHCSQVENVLRLMREAQSGQASSSSELVGSVRAMAAAAWQHIRHEEAAVLPMAKACLDAEDWTDIAEAFEDLGDTELHAQASMQFRELFARITDHTGQLHSTA